MRWGRTGRAAAGGSPDLGLGEPPKAAADPSNIARPTGGRGTRPRRPGRIAWLPLPGGADGGSGIECGRAPPPGAAASTDAQSPQLAVDLPDPAGPAPGGGAADQVRGQ